MTHPPESEPAQDPGLRPRKMGLYDPRYEHDACGVGFIAHIKGKRSHQILVDAEEMLRKELEFEQLAERAPQAFGAGADIVSVVTDITLNPDPEARLRQWIEATR